MSRAIVFQPEAIIEFADAAEWYEERRSGLGVEFEHAVEQTLKSACDMPESFPVAESNARQAVVKGFPYSVFFEHSDEYVVVIAVFHSKRDPREWKRRI